MDRSTSRETATNIVSTVATDHVGVSANDRISSGFSAIFFRYLLLAFKSPQSFTLRIKRNSRPPSSSPLSHQNTKGSSRTFLNFNNYGKKNPHSKIASFFYISPQKNKLHSHYQLRKRTLFCATSSRFFSKLCSREELTFQNCSLLLSLKTMDFLQQYQWMRRTQIPKSQLSSIFLLKEINIPRKRLLLWYPDSITSRSRSQHP